MIDTETLRALVEVEEVGVLYGVESKITPRLIDEIFGDGRLLVGITPLMTRPNYYVVRVDSKTDFDFDEWRRETTCRIHCAAVIQFDEHQDVCDLCDNGATTVCEFPISWMREGYSWWIYKNKQAGIPEGRLDALEGQP